MKKLLLSLSLCLPFVGLSNSFIVTSTVTITNTANLTNGVSSITVDGVVRTWVTTVTNNPSNIQIATNSQVGSDATNLFNAFAFSPQPSNSVTLGRSGANGITMRFSQGLTPTITLTSGWGTVTNVTSVTTNSWLLSFPYTTIPVSLQTNTTSGMVDWLNLPTISTIATNAPAFLAFGQFWAAHGTVTATNGVIQDNNGTGTNTTIVNNLNVSSTNGAAFQLSTTNAGSRPYFWWNMTNGVAANEGRWLTYQSPTSLEMFAAQDNGVLIGNGEYHSVSRSGASIVNNVLLSSVSAGIASPIIALNGIVLNPTFQGATELQSFTVNSNETVYGTFSLTNYTSNYQTDFSCFGGPLVITNRNSLASFSVGSFGSGVGFQANDGASHTLQYLNGGLYVPLGIYAHGGMLTNTYATNVFTAYSEASKIELTQDPNYLITSNSHTVIIDNESGTNSVYALPSGPDGLLIEVQISPASGHDITLTNNSGGSIFLGATTLATSLHMGLTVADAVTLRALGSDWYIVSYHQVGGGTGTVTSVGLSFPTNLVSISGSPVTTSGTLTATLKPTVTLGNLTIQTNFITGSATVTNIGTNRIVITQPNGQALTNGPVLAGNTNKFLGEDGVFRTTPSGGSVSFNNNQFNTSGGVTNIKSGALVTNLTSDVAILGKTDGSTDLGATTTNFVNVFASIFNIYDGFNHHTIADDAGNLKLSANADKAVEIANGTVGVILTLDGSGLSTPLDFNTMGNITLDSGNINGANNGTFTGLLTGDTISAINSLSANSLTVTNAATIPTNNAAFSFDTSSLTLGTAKTNAQQRATLELGISFTDAATGTPAFKIERSQPGGTNTISPLILGVAGVTTNFYSFRLNPGVVYKVSDVSTGTGASVTFRTATVIGE